MTDIDDLLIYFGRGKCIYKYDIQRLKSNLHADATRLCKIMKDEGSDKSLGWHNYTVLYNILLEKYCEKNSSLLEVGIGTNFTDVPSNMGDNGIPGASLRGWKIFLPNCRIYGADIDRRILFEEDGIKTYYVDQTDEQTIFDLWQSIPESKCDIIIDDGLHTFDANSKLFRCSIDKLSDTGLYIIEDIKMRLDNISLYAEYFDKTGLNGFLIRIPYDKNNIDNSVLVLSKNRSK